MSNPPLPRLLAIDELAIQLGTSVRHLRRLVAERRIPFVKLGGKLRFDAVEIAAWVDRGRVHEQVQRDFTASSSSLAAVDAFDIEIRHRAGDRGSGHALLAWDDVAVATPDEIATRALALVRAAEEDLRSMIGGDRSAAYDAVEPLLATRPEDPAALDAIQLVLRLGGCIPEAELDAEDRAWEATEKGDLRVAETYGEELGGCEYADRLVRQRLHQPLFRQRVLHAYGRRCALCRLRHPELLDAAHIRSDADGGEPWCRTASRCARSTMQPSTVTSWGSAHS